MKTFIKKHFPILVFSLVAGAVSALVMISFMVGVIFYNRFYVLDFLIGSYLAEKKTDGYTDWQSQDTRNFFTIDSLVEDVVEKSDPAVVSISVSKNVPVIEQYFEDQDIFGDMFGFSFRIPKFREKGTEKRQTGAGTGFFIDSSGLIITNKHVVDDEKAEYSVFTNKGDKYKAKVLAKDPLMDIAVLKIDQKIPEGGFPYLNFGDSDKLKRGQTVIAIGNALAEFSNTISVGVVSGLGRTIVAGDVNSGHSEVLDEVIQTDAAINPGNSGGPLLDLGGKVVGVNVAVADNSENIGFSLPANLIKVVVESVKKEGKIVRPYLGVRYIPITPELKEKNKLSVDYGVLISRGTNKNELAVVPGSPADKAGLVENDIILEINNTKLTKDTKLSSILRKKEVGNTVSLKILHKGKEKVLFITLEKAPEN